MENQQRFSQLLANEVGGGDTFRQLLVAVAKCGQELKARAAEYDKLLVKHEQLEQKYVEVMRSSCTTAPAAHVVVKDPYVVVLIDCHSHKFRNEMVLDKASGGPKAAHLLRDSVREYLSKMQMVPNAKDCRVEVKAYANLKSISIDAHKEKLADHQPRSLAPFTSGFSRPFGSCDFVDVQDEQATHQKIRDVFQAFIHDPGCKQVFLAASCTATYLQLLQSYSDRQDMVTLVQGEVVDQSMLALGFKRVAFSRVFRTPTVGGVTAIRAKACWNFPKGKCKRPNCRFAHDGDSDNAKLFIELDGNTKMSTQLPIIPNPGRIPVNANNERLDLYMRPPTNAQWAIYDNRIRRRKLCNDHYLYHSCGKIPCEYDHTPLEPDVYDCLLFVLKEWPCKQRGGCRDLGCLKGHVCQREHCEGGCKLPLAMHRVDPRVYEWVMPIADQEDIEDDLDEDVETVSSDQEATTGAADDSLLIEIW